MSDNAHHHRSTLKQENKPFKSKFSSKRSLSRNGKGRTNSSVGSRGRSRFLTKSECFSKKDEARKRHLQVVQQSAKRYTGKNGIPKVISIIGLTPDSDTKTILRKVHNILGVESLKESLPFVVWDEKHKQKYRIIAIDRDPKNVADAGIFSDMVILVLSALEEVDDIGEQTLSILKKIGPPIRAGVVININMIKEKNKSRICKSLSNYLNANFGGRIELFDESSTSSLMKITRWIASKTPQNSVVRGERSYMVSDSCDVLRDDTDPHKCTLILKGYVRGSPMSVDNAIYIPEIGVFQLQKIVQHERDETHTIIDDIPDTDSYKDTTHTKTYLPTTSQAPIVPFNEPYLMDIDQPNLTYKEIKDIYKPNSNKVVVKAPKGTSSYQAAWIVESEDEDSFSEQPSYINDEPCLELEKMSSENLDDTSSIEMAKCNDEHMSEELDYLDENNDQEDYLEVIAQRRLEERTQREFPDEMEFHPNVHIRERLCKYRGIKNIKSSIWDKYESLPIDYAKIFQVKNPKKTLITILKKNSSMAELDVGSLVSVFIKNVPTNALQLFTPQKPPLYISLYLHEEKYTLVNFTLAKMNGYTDVVKSKDKIFIQYGFRRIIANPIYSANSNNSINNVHLFERFLHSSRFSTGTMYAPISFGPTPIIMFEATNSDEQWLAKSCIVATGSLLNMDSTRIIVKRVTLTGHPFKVNKRSAIVRYMFFNPEDANYFKPLRLRTKLGLIGHIIESVGTHGRIKCSFDKQIKSNDTVCIDLYKRVFPKWTDNYSVPCI